MIFVSVEIQNFLSFGYPAQKIALQDRGLLAVFGENKDARNSDSNGSGKSSIYEAMVWCLYGETLRGYKADDVVNRIVGKNCFVSLTIDDDGTVYNIKRTRKFSAKRPNDLILTVNNRPLSQGVNSDTQAIVNSIIGMDFTTFTQSVLLSHGTRPFAAMTDKEQKQVLEDIFQMSVISKARDKCSAKLATKQNDLIQLQSVLQNLTSQITTLTSQRNKYIESRDQYQRQQFDKIIELGIRKTDTEQSFEDLCNDVSVVEYHLTEKCLSDELTNIETEYNQILQGERDCSAKYQGVKVKIATEEGAALSKIRQFQSDINSVAKMSGKKCPTCLQVLNEESASTCVATWKIELQSSENRYTLLQTKKKEYLDKEQFELSKFVEQKNTLQKSKIEVSKKLRENTLLLLSRVQSLKNIRVILNTLEIIKKDIEKLSAETNPYGELIVQLDKDIQELDNRQKDASNKTEILNTEIAHIQYWYKGFGNSGLKSYLLDSVTPFLTARAQKYADILSGGDLTIQFTTQTQLKSGEWRDQFQVVVKNRQGADVYQGNSDGEKSRINIAVGWALGDLAATRGKKPIKFKGLDEPFENLDETGEDAVLKLLHSVVSQYETILCTTHSSHLKSQFRHDITVMKKNGQSVLK